MGLVLAGGAGRRIGGGKEARRLGGTALLERAVGILAPQVAAIAVSVGAARRAELARGIPQLIDTMQDRGPLAGLHAGLVWTRAFHPSAPFLAMIPTDAPFLPATLVAQLADAVGDADAVVASGADGKRTPVVGLFRPALEAKLGAHLRMDTSNAVEAFLDGQRVATAAILADPPIAALGVDPLFNVNTAEDLRRAEKLLQSGGNADR